MANTPRKNQPQPKGGVTPEGPEQTEPSRVAFLFDLDGTLVDSVYPHVLAWSEALEKAGIKLSIWRIHRRMGMSGGLFINALVRETGHQITQEEAARLQQLHAEAYRRLSPAGSPSSRGSGASGQSNPIARPVGHRHEWTNGDRSVCTRDPGNSPRSSCGDKGSG